MAIRNLDKSNFVNEQMLNADEWLQKALNTTDAYMEFSAKYSALNALAWAVGPADGDRKQFLAMCKKLSDALDADPTEHFFRDQLYAQASAFNAHCGGSYQRICDLSKRSNRTPQVGQVMFLNLIDVTSINTAQLDGAQTLQLAIELIYQFRCNLVHGTKAIAIGSVNEPTARLANDLIATVCGALRRLI